MEQEVTPFMELYYEFYNLKLRLEVYDMYLEKTHDAKIYQKSKDGTKRYHFLKEILLEFAG